MGNYIIENKLKEQVAFLEKEYFRHVSKASNSNAAGSESPSSINDEHLFLETEKNRIKEAYEQVDVKYNDLKLYVLEFYRRSESGGLEKNIFDGNFYCSKYNVSPLFSFLNYRFFGKQNGRICTPYFDIDYYCESDYYFGDKKLAFSDFLTAGGWSVIKPNPYFDPKWYRETYPDVAESNIFPLLHYMKFGWKEGRNPSEYFDVRKYLDVNDDVAQAGLEPLAHYLTFGEREERMIFNVGY